LPNPTPAGNTRTVSESKSVSEDSEMSEATITTTTTPDSLLPAECLDQPLEALRRIAQQQIDLLMPIQDIMGGRQSPNSLYGSEIHADLCRKKLMGLSDATAARAVGVTPQTLSHWRRAFPKLAYDMNQATALANAQAAALLQVMMQGPGPTAFHALKLYLETHLSEFQRTAKIEIEHDFKGIVRQVRDIYGLSGPTRTNGNGKHDDESAEDDNDLTGEEEASTEPEINPPLLLDAPISPALPPLPPLAPFPAPELPQREAKRRKAKKSTRKYGRKVPKAKKPLVAAEVLAWL
jgi:hypothetical protein